MIEELREGGLAAQLTALELLDEWDAPVDGLESQLGQPGVDGGRLDRRRAGVGQLVRAFRWRVRRALTSMLLPLLTRFDLKSAGRTSPAMRCRPAWRSWRRAPRPRRT